MIDFFDSINLNYFIKQRGKHYSTYKSQKKIKKNKNLILKVYLDIKRGKKINKKKFGNL